MPKRVTTRSEDGFVSTSDMDGYTIEIDGSGEETPGTLDHLLAAYAACYVPALRVGAEQRNVGELGSLEIEVTGDLNDDDKLAAVSFDISSEANLDGEHADAVIERANALCKVHDALKSDLHADVTIDGQSV